MRHGFAGNKIKDSDEADLDRDLEPEGERQARAVGKHLASLDDPPDKIYTSPTTRALQTAKIVADEVFGDEDEYEIDPNLAEGKPIEMAVVQRTQDESSKRPLLVTHSGNVDRLHHLKGKYGKSVKPDPMATAEVRELKIKRGKVDPGGPGRGPTADWKEKRRILPSDCDGDCENLY